jgi:hypothetical protein
VQARPQMPRASSLAGVALATFAALAGMLLLTSPARARTVATMLATASPNRLGAKGSLTVAIHFTGGEAGIPTPVSRTVVRFPAGMSIEIPHLRSCSAEHLQNLGASQCPAQSKLGQGRALVESRQGSETIVENVALSAFLGPPQHLQPTLEVLGEGTTPIAVRLLADGRVLLDRAPYGEMLVMDMPPIPTVPPSPDASIVDFSLTVGAMQRDGRAGNAIVMPARCPAGGFPFAGEFTYLDGSSSSAKTTIPCPRRSAARR